MCAFNIGFRELLASDCSCVGFDVFFVFTLAVRIAEVDSYKAVLFWGLSIMVFCLIGI